MLAYSVIIIIIFFSRLARNDVSLYFRARFYDDIITLIRPHRCRGVRSRTGRVHAIRPARSSGGGHFLLSSFRSLPVPFSPSAIEELRARNSSARPRPVLLLHARTTRIPGVRPTRYPCQEHVRIRRADKIIHPVLVLRSVVIYVVFFRLELSLLSRVFRTSVFEHPVRRILRRYSFGRTLFNEMRFVSHPIRSLAIFFTLMAVRAQRELESRGCSN